nr:MAG TPA: hypothetical protein [Caudoviricetes sp.]
MASTYSAGVLFTLSPKRDNLSTISGLLLYRCTD